jgi:hypothetical protein
VCGAFPSITGLWAERNLLLSNQEWPRETRLELDRQESVWHCARGESVGLQGWARGKVPAEVKVHLRAASASRKFSIIPGANGRLSFVFPEVIEPFEFHLRGGDGRTEPRRVEVHERPKVLALSFALTFPAYLARAPETLENVAGDVVVPAGTKVLIRARADAPLARGFASWEKGERLELPPRGAAGAAAVPSPPGPPEGARPDHEVEYSLEPKQSGTLDLNVVDAQWGLESRPPVRARFRVEPDAMPKIVLTLKQKARIVTPAASVPYRVEAKDDHGFSRLGLETVLSAGADAPQKDLAGFQGLPQREPEITRDEVLDLGTFDLEPGMRVTLTVEGADNDGIAGPKTARSNSEVLTVVEVEEFREAMARARAAARRELEEALNREERILREFQVAVATVEGEAGDAGDAAGGAGGGGRQGARAKSAREEKARPEKREADRSKAAVAEPPPEAAEDGKKAEEKSQAAEAGEGGNAVPGQQGSRAGRTGKAAGQGQRAGQKGQDQEGQKDGEPAGQEGQEAGQEGQQDGQPGGKQGQQGGPEGRQGGQQQGGQQGKQAGRQGGQQQGQAAGRQPGGQQGGQQAGQENPKGERAQPAEKSAAEAQPAEEKSAGPRQGRQAGSSSPRSLEGLGREQADAGQKVKRASQELREVMDALDQNRMLSDAEKRRFEAEVASPLGELGEERFPRTASELNRLSKPESGKESRAQTQKELEQIAEDLRGVLDRLQDTEDFSDVLQRLEGVLQLHRQAIHTTRERTGAPPKEPPPESPPRRGGRKKDL